MGGWIKIHTKLLKWQWYDDTNMVRLWLHCLLKANYKDKKWHEKIIPRGSFVTSYSELSEETGLSIQTVRTCIDRLKESECLTYKPTSKFSIVTISNYDTYQVVEDGEQQASNKQVTSKTISKVTSKNSIVNICDCDSYIAIENDCQQAKQQASNKQSNKQVTSNQQASLVTKEEYIEDKKERIVVVVDNAHARESFDCLIQKGNSYFDLICMRMGWTEEDYFNAVTDFEATCEVDGIKHGGEKDILDHFRNWVSKRYRFGEKPFKKVESQQQQNCAVKKYNDGFSGDPSGYTEKL